MSHSRGDMQTLAEADRAYDVFSPRWWTCTACHLISPVMTRQQCPDPYTRFSRLEREHSKLTLRDSRFIPYIQLHEFEAFSFRIQRPSRVYYARTIVRS